MSEIFCICFVGVGGGGYKLVERLGVDVGSEVGSTIGMIDGIVYGNVEGSLL